MAKLQVDIPDALKEDLRKCCFVQHVSQIEVVKNALESYFAQVFQEKKNV